MDEGGVAVLLELAPAAAKLTGAAAHQPRRLGLSTLAGPDGS